MKRALSSPPELGARPLRTGVSPARRRLDDLLARTKDALREEAQKAADACREPCRAARLDAVTAIVDEAMAVPSLARHARCCDLTVISQADPDDPHHAAVLQ